MTVIEKNIRYLSKDFTNFRSNLINFAKIYFPNTYSDFNETSPGMMFIEMAAYVGDVLSYYIDKQLRENLVLYAQERENVVAKAYEYGYQTKPSTPAITTLDIFQVVPSIGAGSSVAPDFNYALKIESMEVQSDANSDVHFTIDDDVDFSVSSSTNPTDITIYESNSGTGDPSYYLLKKSIFATAGSTTSETFTFGEPEQFNKIVLGRDNIIEIKSIIDSDGYNWYEVPYLAQDTVFVEIENTEMYDYDLSQYHDVVPYLLKLKRTARRFIKRVRSDNKTEIQFGSGVSINPDEIIVPNPENVGSSLPGSGLTQVINDIDPSNFLYTRTFGLVPFNTTLTVTYSYGGGIESNVFSGDLINISKVIYSTMPSSLSQAMISTVKSSVAVINPNSAVGGKSYESTDEIRHNTLAYFSTQNRAVTKQDYIIRAYAMPGKYGSVAKVHVVQDDQLGKTKTDVVNLEYLDSYTNTYGRIINPLAINMYVLGYDANNYLTVPNDALKENLKIYIGQYRLLTDAINIKNGYIINIGCNFVITASSAYNKNEVLLNCITELKDFFDIKKWSFNQSIILAEITSLLMQISGVLAVNDILITNKWDTVDGYSGNIYDINAATKNGIIYPSLDPSIFEIKYLDRDIKGSAR